MKVAVLGDLHLGRSLYGYDLTFDIRKAMYSFVEICIHYNVDVAIQLGDVFDRPMPNEQLRKIVVQWFNEFERARIPLYVLVGNHDALARHGTPSALEAIRTSAHIYTRIVDRPLMENWGSAQLLFLPFPSPGIYGDDPGLYDEEVTHARARAVKGRPIWAFSHLNVEGAKMGNQEWIYRGGERFIPKQVMKDKKVKLIVGGHIHKPQQIGTHGRISLVGAAERLRFDETDQRRNFMMIHDPWFCAFVARPDTVHLRELELDASGWAHGGDPPSTDELIKSISYMNLRGAIVKVTPFVDTQTFVVWRDVVEAIYRMGARHVHLAPPIQAKKESKRKARSSESTVLDDVKVFIKDRVGDKGERKELVKLFKRIQKAVEANSDS